MLQEDYFIEMVLAAPLQRCKLSVFVIYNSMYVLKYQDAKAFLGLTLERLIASL